MKTLELDKAKKTLAEYAKKVKKEPVIITIDGKPLAALVGISGTDLETVSLSNNPKFLDLIERSRTNLKSEGGISIAEMRRRLKKKLQK
ncbi:type II toxin-antitoxin system prevent-host-death family antitoxin [bacterium]|nr:type II toxin-antitoxin system prevent-host-death family antitoxin [bacterium]